MVSDITLKKTLLDMPEGVILESRSGGFDSQKSWEEADEDDLDLALAWIKNIG